VHGVPPVSGPDPGTGRAASAAEPWRSIDELRRRLPPPVRAPAAPDGLVQIEGMSRRRFVQLLGASAALAGAAACDRPRERILPYVTHPPDVLPGEPSYYATSFVLDGYATGLLVESRGGRPTKVEGNPEHPASLGAAGVHEQASLLELYDPDRARRPRHPGAGPFDDAFAREFLDAARAQGGAGLRVLLEPTSSPLVIGWIERLRAALPGVRVHFLTPLEQRTTVQATTALFGAPLVPRYDFGRADVVVSLDADFLADMPFHLRHARDCAERRRPAGGRTMSRLYAFEPAPTVTGAAADHRVRVRASSVQSIAATLLAEVQALRGTTGAVPDARVRASSAPPVAQEVLSAVARDLVAAAGRALVVPGERQPPVVHALAHLLNDALGAIGATVAFLPSPIFEAGGPSHDLEPLLAELRAGAVRTLVVAGVNPSYTVPLEHGFDELLRRVPRSLRLGLYEDETARACGWFVPALHALESWGDARAYDGTLSTIQPLVAPLYGARTTVELLALLAGDAAPQGRALLRAAWAADDASFDGALRLGLVPGSAFAPAAVTPNADAVGTLLEAAGTAPAGTPAGGIEVVVRRDARVHDGRFANNAWLQELPDPITKLTWGNAAALAPALADRLGIETGDVVEVAAGAAAVRLPALVVPGHADDCVSLRTGYGRAGAESVGRDVGVDVRALAPAAAPYHQADARVTPTGDAQPLALTQSHWTMRGRPIVLSTTLAELERGHEEASHHRGPTPSLYEPHDYTTGDQWTMVIDLARCTGCSACVVACQAENNVPVVGKEGVLASREMHWLRIDRYHTGEPDAPGFTMQPMLCQHCEKAPCEYVCPVNATVHSPDGLNEMVYNRCVGTRFCSNNCPYKVRRFNWYDYNGDLSESERLRMNPDVSVRDRGVMEKCTFCVQRIRRSGIAAKLEGRARRPGEVVTACQQACPSRAIAFGSYTNPDDALTEALNDPRRYSVLHELGTQPRVHYLMQVRNPNPALERGT
jgi:Fe-S-cluster-containing dehydrogenase component